MKMDETPAETCQRSTSAGRCAACACRHAFRKDNPSRPSRDAGGCFGTAGGSRRLQLNGKADMSGGRRASPGCVVLCAMGDGDSAVELQRRPYLCDTCAAPAPAMSWWSCGRCRA
jgi:hypothetical protein